MNIDEQLLAEAKIRAAREHRTLGEVIDDALRISLYRVEPRADSVTFPVAGDPANRPLVDILDKEALAEVLGDNEWPRRADADR